MPVLTPEGTVRLIKVPFDNSYSHLLDFAYIGDQEDYFESLPGLTFLTSEYKYIRRDQYIAVNKNPDELVGINYVMYRNNSWSDKWFYAFVTRIEWLSDNSSACYLETDVWQTWQFNIQLKNSFILREHATVDFPGHNVQPEGFELGEYQPVNFNPVGLSDLCFVLATTISGFAQDGTKINANGAMFSGIYSGAALYAYENNANGVAAMNTRLNELVDNGYPEAVIAIYMCPKAVLEFSGADWFPQTATYQARSLNFSIPRPGSIGGYTPRNKKLLTYPYRMVYAHNNNGSAAIFRCENFTNDTMSFKVKGIITPDPSFKLYPDTTSYNHFSASLEEALTLKSFAFCSWAYDSYRAWLAQNGSSQAVSTIGNIVAGAGAVIAGGAALAATIATGGAAAAPIIAGGLSAAGGISTIFSALARKEETEIQPTQSQGNALSGSVNCGSETNDFYIGLKEIRSDLAQRIDGFFDMYGYATNELKAVVIRNRPKYNYIRTGELNATGNIPPYDMQRIKRIFNDGVTFWHDPSNFLNYLVNNQIGA